MSTGQFVEAPASPGLRPTRPLSCAAVWPVFFRIGPFHVFGFELSLPINAFGTMMAIAFLVARYFTSREMSRKGMDGELGWTLMFWAAVGGLVGSRLWILVDDPGLVLRSPWAVVSGSGFVWYGGLIGGTLAVSWLIRRETLSWLKVADCVAPALAIGHAIGRIGCQLAGDGDWGKVSDVPWAMAYPNAIIGWDYPPGVRVHPTPVYEMLAYLAVFGILWSIRKRQHPDGTLFWLYLVLAATARFAVEFFRINSPVFLGLTEAQLFSLVLVGIGAWRLAVGGAERGAAAQEVRVKPRPRRP
jgi:phosphatidylglycerol:prolipoprotein diacylglycerol transferase